MQQLIDALAVLMLQPDLARLIHRLDPQAFRQAQRALEAVGLTIATPCETVRDGAPWYRPDTYREEAPKVPNRGTLAYTCPACKKAIPAAAWMAHKNEHHPELK